MGLVFLDDVKRVRSYLYFLSIYGYLTLSSNAINKNKLSCTFFPCPMMIMCIRVKTKVSYKKGGTNLDPRREAFFIDSGITTIFWPKNPFFTLLVSIDYN